MKNLLNERIANQLITRIEKLTPQSKSIWGQMNSTEMLAHCNSCNKQILEESRTTQKTVLKQYLLRILAIYLAPKFTKGRITEEQHITKGKFGDDKFETQKELFKTIIKKFPQNNKELTLTHPAFGNISTHQWGIAAYKHMDHHLRQFGV
ncbi:DUF1569 domain-containing protein [uncultured Flavobacterium sp.]|uniref:DUF1569 domain-containing protein n=1 Tax=uncultured Flavobacterium sp. TaxID=165435 RepID=UPI00293112C7|nr:DUF1569 domain-containing protein [uncultured Flavobacterium sp.]